VYEVKCQPVLTPFNIIIWLHEIFGLDISYEEMMIFLQCGICIFPCKNYSINLVLYRAQDGIYIVLTTQQHAVCYINRIHRIFLASNEKKS